MPNQDRIDTLTGLAWAALYREDGKVGPEALEVLYNHDDFGGLLQLLMDYLHEPAHREGTSTNIAELLAGIVRDEFADQVRQILDAEDERDRLWNSCRMTPEHAQAEDERLDDPRHEEAKAQRGAT